MAAITEDRPRHTPGKMGQHGHLEVEDMAALFANDLLPGASVNFDGDLVPHSAAGNKNRGLASEYFCRTLFQPIDGWVFAVNIVANLGLRHRAAHFCRRLGDGVAAQVNGAGNFLFCFFRLRRLQLGGHI